MTATLLTDIERANLAAVDVLQEYLRARQKHAPMHGAHEGYAVILEEVDELWDEVRGWQPNDKRKEAMRKEALQVAAMALAFMVEVCGE